MPLKKSAVYHGDEIRLAAELKLRERKKIKEFHDTYYNNRVAFAKDLLNWEKLDSELAPYQEHKILKKLDEHDRLSVRSLHGVGKTFSLAMVIWHFALTRNGTYEWKILTTASVWRQLERFLWPEIHKMSRYIHWDRTPLGRIPNSNELLTMELKLSTGTAFAVSCEDPQNIEGAHEDEMLYVFDESKAVPDAVFDAAEGAFSHAGKGTKKTAKAISVSTPGAPMGRFYDIQTRKPGFEDWEVVHIGLQDGIDAGRVSPEWAENRRRQWGENDNRYINRVLGNFAESVESGVIPREWLMTAFQRYNELAAKGHIPDLVTCISADFADAGDDESVIGRTAIGNVFLGVEEIAKVNDNTAGINLNVIETRLTSILRTRNYQHLDVILDSTGMGAGPTGNLRSLIERESLPVNLYSFIARKKAEGMCRDEIHSFTDTRAAAWWNLREMLEPFRGFNIAIKPDEILEKELTTPTYELLAGNRVKVEGKKDLRKPKRLGRSPNRADVVVQAFFTQSENCSTDDEANGFWVI